MAVDDNRATAKCYFVISVKNGAVLYSSCEPCRASSLGRCSHVVTFHFSEIAFLQIQINIFFMFPSPEYLMNLLYLLSIKVMVQLPVYRISTIVLQQNYIVANIFFT